jgi:ubiquitin-conjugating enzyme E2 G1
MLISPNLESPANVDASVLYKNDRNAFNKKLRLLARKSIGDL